MAKTVKIPIAVIDRFSKTQAKLDKNLSSLEKKIAKLDAKAKGSSASFGFLKTAMLGVFGGISAAGALRFLTSSIEKFNQQEEAVQGAGVAMKIAGDFSEQALEQSERWASALQEQIAVGDEVILQNFALAKAYAGTNEESTKLTEAAFEFAAAADLNVTEAVRRLGRAMRGSTDDVAKFVPEIKNLTASQLAAGKATDLILAKFGGTAAGRTDNFRGRVARLTNRFGDLQEKLAEKAIPTLDLWVRALDKATAAAQRALTTDDKSLKGRQLAIVHLEKLQAQLGATAASQERFQGSVEASLQSRLDSIDKALERERTLFAAEQEAAAQRENNHARGIEMDAEAIASKEFAALAISRLEAKLLGNKVKILQIEQKERLKAFQKEVKDEKAIAKFKGLLEKETNVFKGKLDEVELKRKTAQAKAQLQLTTSLAQSTVDLASQVFSKNKALAIASLAVQKAIAIGNTLASYAKLGPFGQALAAARVGLLVASFAQQASAVQGTNLSSGAVSAPSFDQPNLNFPSSEPTGPVPSVPGTTTTTGVSSASSGRAPAQVTKNITINLGGTQIDLLVESLDTSNVAEVMRQIGDELERKNVEAVQLALRLSEASDEFEGQAV